MKIKLFSILIVAALLVQLSLIVYKPTHHEVHLKQSSFERLPGWKTTNTQRSLLAFQISCKAFLKQDPDKSVGSQFIDLKARDWHPVCQAAMLLKADSEAIARSFFQTWFSPVEFYDNRPVRGLFTGYYMPLLQGSLIKTKHYSVPIYGIPKRMVTANLGLFSPDLAHRKIVGRVTERRVVPFYTREQINKGAIAAFTPVIVWVNNSIDRLILEIEGSGIVKLTNGSQLALGYAGENGAPYTSIARVLIDKGVMTRDNASMQHIRKYLDNHPEQVDSIFNQNKSFVFFDTLRSNIALGAQGVALTPGYSLAIDRKWVPMGVPLWLSTTRPDHQLEAQKPFHRLMIAQDTGGAIRGAVRGDVYWGEGEKATAIAGRMKNPGHYWLLLPRHTLDRLLNEQSV